MEKVALMSAVAGLFIFAMGVLSARKTRAIHKMEIKKINEVPWLDPRPQMTASPPDNELAMSLAAKGTGNVQPMGKGETFAAVGNHPS